MINAISTGLSLFAMLCLLLLAGYTGISKALCSDYYDLTAAEKIEMKLKCGE